ncbi:MAG: DUF4145 domain-containing protein [Magnetococcales bacterium]|nr:DUF4145 domain-containing protein [Magnetococcales bacterium]
MQSLNFEFLRPSWPQLAELGGFAESYARPDPGSVLVKLRTFAEQLVLWIYDRAGFPKPYQSNLNDLLNENAFTEAVPKVVVKKLHAIRIHGNKAAHGEKASTNPTAASTTVTGICFSTSMPFRWGSPPPRWA